MIIAANEKTGTLTDFLFQCAVTESSRKRRVVFVTRDKLNRIPAAVDRMPRWKPFTPESYKVRFVHPKNAAELTAFLTSMDLASAEERPDLAVIDALQDFFPSSRSGQMASFEAALAENRLKVVVGMDAALPIERRAFDEVWRIDDAKEEFRLTHCDGSEKINDIFCIRYKKEKSLYAAKMIKILS